LLKFEQRLLGRVGEKVQREKIQINIYNFLGQKPHNTHISLHSGKGKKRTDRNGGIPEGGEKGNLPGPFLFRRNLKGVVRSDPQQFTRKEGCQQDKVPGG